MKKIIALAMLLSFGFSAIFWGNSMGSQYGDPYSGASGKIAYIDEKHVVAPALDAQGFDAARGSVHLIDAEEIAAVYACEAFRVAEHDPKVEPATTQVSNKYDLGMMISEPSCSNVTPERANAAKDQLEFAAGRGDVRARVLLIDIRLRSGALTEEQSKAAMLQLEGYAMSGSRLAIQKLANALRSTRGGNADIRRLRTLDLLGDPTFDLRSPMAFSHPLIASLSATELEATISDLKSFFETCCSKSEDFLVTTGEFSDVLDIFHQPPSEGR